MFKKVSIVLVSALLAGFVIFTACDDEEKVDPVAAAADGKAYAQVRCECERVYETAVEAAKGNKDAIDAADAAFDKCLIDIAKPYKKYPAEFDEKHPFWAAFIAEYEENCKPTNKEDDPE